MALTGASLGVALGISIGPGILRMIDTAMAGERRRALAIALGLLGADGVYLAIATTLFGSPAGENSFTAYRVPLAWLAFAILSFFAVQTWRGSPASPEAGKTGSFRRTGGAFLSGFFLNLFNPFIPVFWFGALSSFVLQHGDAARDRFPRAIGIFAVACLGTVFLTDVAKILLFENLGSKLKGRNSKGIEPIRRFGAVLIFLFGLRILYVVYFGDGAAG